MMINIIGGLTLPYLITYLGYHHLGAGDPCLLRVGYCLSDW